MPITQEIINKYEGFCRSKGRVPGLFTIHDDESDLKAAVRPDAIAKLPRACENCLQQGQDAVANAGGVLCDDCEKQVPAENAAAAAGHNVDPKAGEIEGKPDTALDPQAAARKSQDARETARRAAQEAKAEREATTSPAPLPKSQVGAPATKSEPSTPLEPEPITNPPPPPEPGKRQYHSDTEKKLAETFGRDVQARLQQVTHPDYRGNKKKQLKPPYPDGSRGMFIHYIDARQASDRLDDVFGVKGWSTNFEIVIPYTKGEMTPVVLCTITVDGVSKSDVGYPNSSNDKEPFKSAFSDALKRAAVQWGVGRYLYALDATWHNIDKWGNPTKGGSRSGGQQQSSQRSSQRRSSGTPRGGASNEGF